MTPSRIPIRVPAATSNTPPKLPPRDKSGRFISSSKASTSASPAPPGSFPFTRTGLRFPPAPSINELRESLSGTASASPSHTLSTEPFTPISEPISLDPAANSFTPSPELFELDLEPPELESPALSPLTNHESLPPRTNTPPPAAPPQIMATPAQMPTRGHHSAPKFTGEGQFLSRFFDEIEALAVAANLNDRDKILWTLRYAENAEYEIWSTGLPEASGANWIAFKTAVTRLYPGSDDDRRYTVSNFESFCELHSRKVMRTKEDLGKYHREFLTISTFLKGKSRISEREVNKLYFSGFDSAFQQKIREHLQLRNPLHHPDDLYNVNDIYEVATFILDAPVPTIISNLMPSRERAPALSPVKQEPFDMSAIQAAITASMQTAMTAATQNMTTMMQQFATSILQPTIATNLAASQTPYRPYQPPAPATYTPTVPVSAAPAQPQNTPLRPALPPRCPFCYETTSHTRMQQCTIYHAALRKNWVYRNENGRLVLPNGQEITRALRGGCFMEQIENWRRDNNYPMDTPDPAASQTTIRDPPPHQPAPAPPPVASANLITVGNYNWSEAEDPSASIEEVDEEDGPYDIPMEEQLTIAQNVISTLFKQKKPDSTKKEVRFEQPKRATRSSTASTTTPTPPAATTTPAKRTPSSSTPIPPPPPPVNHLKEALETGQIKSNPQYRYQSNAEDPKIASSVIERALDAPVTVTQRELLALAPELRRHIRDLTMTKRVPTSDTKVLYQECTTDCGNAEASSFFNSEADFEQEHALSLLVQEREQLVSANDMESLRVVTLKLEDTHFVSCILDSGSQIISMRRAIWEALAIPLDLDKGLVMESANLTTNKTLGLARNIKASIGELDFYLQIQVVESAPYDILLGRPFHCLLSAVTQDYPDGRQDISLRDPNSNLRISVPTTER
ncbi:hypothetical protein CCMSSC00406_0004182 [Pleurotus cornucopiae]|uniref:Uncharacterized protein n=1 Tax=Pleurotus cornucopiae TaxID=5321 RepID=A0ACB7J9L4_PLECO|nr:hypothetical protein CCMSSC00406_0004182 [Pleurotus cornucopiae]